MVKKILSVLILFIFTFTGVSFDFFLLKNLPVPVISKVSIAYADTTNPYCLPTNDGTKTGVFSQEAGYCILEPENSTGKCLAPYVYSTDRKVCISQPLCPGLYIWNAETKRCESVTVTPVGDTEPVFPENSCAVDANGNGEIEQNEIHQCQQTPQGYICPAGQTQCDPQYQQPTCPAQYTYNPQTQKCEYTPQIGVCSSQQVQTTQYQCPTTGIVYSDSGTCNSACIQTAQCSSSSNSCNTNTTWIYYAVRYPQPTSGWWGYITCNEYGCRYSATVCNTGADYMYVEPGNCERAFGLYKGQCQSTYFNPANGTFIYAQKYTCSVGGGPCPMTKTQTTLWCGRVINIMSTSSCTSYTCPLPGGSACTGNPPTCTAGQACVTYNSTVTKWQCSLNGTQYDTQEQCTTSCYSGCPSGGIFNPTTGKCEATATCQTGTLQAEGCFTGYGCPLGQYQCQNVNGTWMCSPYQCITSSQLQDEGDVIPSGYDDDGPRDEQGNCLGTIYIFNGKGMRCRKSGVQTGFHNCCNESQGKLYDSTGSTGGGLGAIKNIAEILYGVYSAINVGQIASQLATNGASSIAITMQNGVVTRVVIPGYGTVTGQQAQSLVNGLMQNGNLQYLGQSGNEVFARVVSGGADTATAGTMSDFLKNSGIANSVVSLATSMLIQDPVLSSAVNVAAQSVLWAFGYTSPLGLATAVIGLATNLFMKRCDKQDIITSTFKESGYCHEVGEYCIKKWPLVGCVQKAKGFCCFNSKLARIIHEQGRPQLVGFGINSWGSPKNPNCRGFLPEEFQALDFNKIDLSEYIQDIQRNIRQNLAPQLQQQIQQSWGQ